MDVTVRPVSAGKLDARHRLGHRLAGQVLRYVAEMDRQWVAVLGFGSAALSCAGRDRFIGWSPEQLYAWLIHVANNQRFCVLPAGRPSNLAPAVLARALRACNAGRPWLVPGFCEKTRDRYGRDGQHKMPQTAARERMRWSAGFWPG